jgi:hypothetical protein
MVRSTRKPARTVSAALILLATASASVGRAQDVKPPPDPAAMQPGQAAAGSASVGVSAQAGGQAPANGSAQASIDPNDADPAALDDFRQPLAPYGTWEEDPSYGTVWVPSREVVGTDFAPYVTAGHWALTDGDEWMWVSDYDWGWAPFHYGRWIWISGRGWAWIPGRVYAPAWVVWRTGYYDGYYVGWAAMPPTWYWWGGYAYGFGYYPHAHYVFVPSAYAFHPHVHQHIVPAASVGVVGARSQPYVAAGTTGGYRSLAYTRAPTVEQAHVPANAAPMQRTAPDRRALSYARPYNPGFARPEVTAGGGRTMPGAQQPWAQPGFAGRTPSYGQPAPGYPRSPAPYSAPPSAAPRSFAPSPQQAAPAPRSFAPSPQPAAPAPRSFAPAPRSIAPAPAQPSGGGGFRGGGSLGGGGVLRGGGGRR